MTTLAKVKGFTDGNELVEIYQSIAMKFSLADIDRNGVIIQCHPWVQCRDYLHDAIRTQLTGKVSKVYGFKFEKGVNPDICLTKTCLLISQQGIVEGYKDTFENNLRKALVLINYYEDLVGIVNSTLRKVEGTNKTDYKYAWLFEGNYFWLSEPYLISLLTMLLRIGSRLPDDMEFELPNEMFKRILKGKKDSTENDIKYLRTCCDCINPLIENYHELFEDGDLKGFSKLYYEDIPTRTFHNHTGILSVCDGSVWSASLNKKVKEILKDVKE